MVSTSNTDDVTAYSGALRTASRNDEAVISATEAHVKVILKRSNTIVSRNPNDFMKRSSSIIKNMPISSDEVRAVSAVDEVTTMNFVPTAVIGAECVAVQSKAKKIVDIFELSDSDDE
jgi:hypothetical protein